MDAQRKLASGGEFLIVLTNTRMYNMLRHNITSSPGCGTTLVEEDQCNTIDHSMPNAFKTKRVAVSYVW